jgi:phosphatidylglycerophosphatase A
MKWSERAAVFMATGCGAGNIPVAPGTFGSVVGLLLCYLVSLINPGHGVLVIAGFCVLAIRVAGEAEKYLGQKDPGCIVIDEMAGLMVALWGLPFNMAICLTGFLLFRIFDIAKPFPIRHIEKYVPGGFGIVLDDVLAGVYANLALRVGIRIVKGEW